MSSNLESLQRELPIYELDMLPKSEYTATIIEIVGVLSDIKPVTIIEETDQRVVGLLQGLGLKWDSVTGDNLVIASKDERSLGEMKYWVDGPEAGSDKGHQEIGKLLGYPETATDYFIKRLPTMDLEPTEQLPMILPVSLEGTVSGLLHHFVLSPDNWQQEIDNYIVPLERAVHDYTPRTYHALERLARRQKVIYGIGRFLGRGRRDPFDGHAKIEWVK